MGLPVLGICTADGRCGALEEAISELETAKGRLDESVSEVDGRDDTRDCSWVAFADAKSRWRAPTMEAVKVSTDKAGDVCLTSRRGRQGRERRTDRNICGWVRRLSHLEVRVQTFASCSFRRYKQAQKQGKKRGCQYCHYEWYSKTRCTIKVWCFFYAKSKQAS